MTTMFEGPFNRPQKALFTVRVCTNRRLGNDDVPSCGKGGALPLVEELERLVLEKGWPVEVIRSPCMNSCADGPNLRVQGSKWFSRSVLDDVPDIMDCIEEELQKRTSESETD